MVMLKSYGVIGLAFFAWVAIGWLLMPALTIYCAAGGSC